MQMPIPSSIILVRGGKMLSCIASVGVVSEVQEIPHTAEQLSEAEKELDQ